jgi:VCBS repeat protein/FG-GAP repeat protein
MLLAELLDGHLLVGCRLHPYHTQHVPAGCCGGRTGALPATNKPSNTNSWNRRAPLQAMIALGLAVFTALLAAPEGRAQTPNATPTPPPSAQTLHDWRMQMRHVPLPRTGCFTVSHPSTEWQETPCTAAPARPYPPRRGARPDTVGNGNDVSAEVTSGLISEAIGSFDSVTGVTSESGNVNGVPPLVPNTFSLQLNTNFFTTSVCNGAANPSACVGWQQFVYSNSGIAFVQYWLIRYNATCPAGWFTNTTSTGNDCYTNGSNGTSVPTQTITNLGNLALTGQANAGGMDTLIMGVGSTLYSAQNADSILNLAQGWQAAEFNIVGDCCGSQAVFNSGSTIVVRTSVDNGSPSAPSCLGEGFTGETNNLYFVQASAVPPRESLPAVVFTQSSASSTTTACNSATIVAAASSKTATHDFNGDGISDILWRDTSGNVEAWFMECNAAQLSCGGTSSANFGSLPANWSIVGQRDFDGDGKSDILWRDTSGNVAIWFSGAQAQSAMIGNLPTVWSIVGTGDFNGDGKNDILWRDTSGNVQVWFMNCDAAQLSCEGSSSANFGLVPVSWSIAGTGDLNGDGKTDILWRDTSGNVEVWFLNCGAAAQLSCAGSWSANFGLVPISWSIAGTGDFNGDGKNDILWRDTNGNVEVWFMNCDVAQLSCDGSSSANLGALAASWSIVMTGDYNGDGKSDILWRDTSGNVAIWFINGAQVQPATIANVPTVWSIQSANAD